MKRLRVPPLDQKTKDYPRGVVFRVGLFTGMCLVSMAAVILSLINIYNNTDFDDQLINPIQNVSRTVTNITNFMLETGEKNFTVAGVSRTLETEQISVWETNIINAIRNGNFSCKLFLIYRKVN